MNLKNDSKGTVGESEMNQALDPVFAVQQEKEYMILSNKLCACGCVCRLIHMYACVNWTL